MRARRGQALSGRARGRVGEQGVGTERGGDETRDAWVRFRQALCN